MERGRSAHGHGGTAAGGDCTRRVCQDWTASAFLESAGLGPSAGTANAQQGETAGPKKTLGGATGESSAPGGAPPTVAGVGQSSTEPLQCPVDGPQLGRSTWTFLHTFAAEYPPQPTPQQRTDAKSLVDILSRMYPCSSCADHLNYYLKNHPVETASQHALSQWMCHMHNDVNRRLGKPVFDCARVDERWLTGPPSGECDNSQL